jgi:hypothetical protein
MSRRSTRIADVGPRSVAKQQRRVRPSKVCWLATALVVGLLLFCALAFGLDDESLRSTLIGGLVATSSAASPWDGRLGDHRERVGRVR